MKITIPTGSTKKHPLIIADKFDKGTVTLIDEARILPTMAKESKNLIQTQDGLWSQRWGQAFYGSAIASELIIDGGEEYVASATTRHIIVVGGTTGNLYRSIDDGKTWTILTGATMTPGKKPFFIQINSIMLIANGVDNLIQYNGTTVLATYASLSAPVGVGLARTVLVAGSYTMYYQITALNAVGETVGSTEASITVNKVRDNWVTGENVTVTWTAVGGATRYQIYWADESGHEAYIDSITSNSYIDDGSVQQNPYIVVPNDNTTTAPKFRQMELSMNRIWATGDLNNPYRVHFTGVGQDINKFSAWYGGGWVDLDKGGREMPLAIKHYRTGKGDSAATVLCNNPEGEGTIWQVTLESVTVGSTSFTVPVPVKIVGSVGTTSPYGVVKTGNDLIFPNKQGVFTLGTPIQTLNILATAEKSQLIRPSYRGMNQSKVGDICGITHDAKVFFSCAIGSVNDTTFIYDAERKNWNWSWDFGAKQWFKTTDTSGKTHLLYIPPTGGKLVEVSESFNTDFGQPIKTSYISGLIPFSKDDTTFAKVKEVVVTIGRLKGTILVEILGIEAKRGFSTVGTKQVSDASSSIMFTENIFGSYKFSHRNGAPKTFSQANIKKRIRVGKKLNKIQIHISSANAGTEFTLLNFQVTGAIIPTALPSQWK